MRTLTRFFFAVSDVIAWLMFFCLLFFAVSLPFLAPVFAQMDHLDVSWMETAFAVAMLLTVAMLFYATIRRKALGVVVLCTLPAWLWQKENPAVSLWGVAIFLAVFAMPYGLAYIDMRLKKAAP